MFIRKLAIANLVVRKSRAALTVSAVALSVSLVVAVTSGYASLFEAAFKYLNQYMGATDAHISRSNDPVGIPQLVVDRLRQDPMVRRADGRVDVSSFIIDPSIKPDAPKGKPDERNNRKFVRLVGIDRPSDRRVEQLAMDAGRWFDSADGDVAVIDQAVGEILHVGVLDKISLPYANKTLSATIVGVAHKPAVVAAHLRTIYLPLHTLQKLVGAEGRVSDVWVDLANQTEPAKFSSVWQAKLSAPALTGEARGGTPSSITLDPATASAEPMAYAGMSIRLTGGAGAGEQGTITSYSGADRVATIEPAWSIPPDSTTKFQLDYPKLQVHLAKDIRSQMDTNLQGISMLSYLGSAVSMLAATFIVFSALSMGVTERQRSLAMLRAVGALKSQIAVLVVVEGLILAGAGIFVGVPLGAFWVFALARWFPGLFTAGAVLSMGGIAFGAAGTLLAALAASALPAWNATRVSPLEAMTPLATPAGSGPPVGWAAIGLAMTAVDPLLFFGPVHVLASMLHHPEAARPITFYGHFAVGLPLLFVGFFLLAPMCVWITEKLVGPLAAGMFGLRFVLLRQQLSSGLWRAAGTAAALMVGLTALVVLQVNGHTLLGGWTLPDKFPDIFIGSSGLSAEEQAQLAATPGIRSLMPITIASTSLGGAGGSPFAIGYSMLLPSSTMFLGVDPEKAFSMMGLDFREGNAAEAQQRLRQGDWVIVTQEYRNITGKHVGDQIELGGHAFRIAAVIWSPGIDVMVGMYDMGSQFEQRTASSVFGSLADSYKYFGARAYIFAADLQPGVERVDLIKRIKKELTAKGLQVGDVRQIKAKIESGFYQLLNLMSTVGFAAMAVASLGVTNTIMAAVRSRQWQFGILRSIGVTRGQLLRLVLAEALLLGVVGTALGLGAGFELSFDANAMASVIAGYTPRLVVPWGHVALGSAAVLLVSLAASVWPAASVARAEPLALLQAGRSAG